MDKAIPEEVTLKQICKERKLDPRLSRMLLREAVKDAKKYPNLSKDRAARAPWVWAKGSKGLEEALAALNATQPQKSPTEKVAK
ncbi:MAG: hypothetical protein JNL76_08385 [Alphaproteobacteria bacterium]|nr:hypothetical protein [Alphaproteobacteria bacterium]